LASRIVLSKGVATIRQSVLRGILSAIFVSNNPSPTMAVMQVTYALTQHDFFDSTIAIRNRKKWAK